MTRFMLAGLIICIAPLSAFAQETNTCMTPAQVERDRCTRAEAGDNVASRRCMERYLDEMERCSKAPAFSRDRAEPSIRVDPMTKPQVE
jgi:hypothetical protein